MRLSIFHHSIMLSWDDPRMPDSWLCHIIHTCCGECPDPMAQSQSKEASPWQISATKTSTSFPKPSGCMLSSKRPSSPPTTTCYLTEEDPCRSKLSTPPRIPRKYKSTQQILKRRHPSRPTWTAHRKARSLSSSVSAGKSSHGAQPTCQEYVGNLPSTLLI